MPVSKTKKSQLNLIENIKINEQSLADFDRVIAFDKDPFDCVEKDVNNTEW